MGALLAASQRIANRAEIVMVGIGVYWDVTCTRKCESINWGALNPGESRTITIYVKNEGGAPITGSFSANSWVPPLAADFISLDWDFGGSPLLPGRVRTTRLTLTVARDIRDVTTFYFVITVTGTQYIS